MENPIKMDDLGVPIIFGNIHIEYKSSQPQEGTCWFFLEGIAVPLLANLHLPVFDDDVKLKLRFLHSMSNKYIYIHIVSMTTCLDHPATSPTV